jgi:hypothetical protein
MNKIFKSFVDNFNQDNPNPCWLSADHEMRLWAEDRERRGQYGHGLGDLNKYSCEPKPGETCPACGIHWDIR